MKNAAILVIFVAVSTLILPFSGPLYAGAAETRPHSYSPLVETGNAKVSLVIDGGHLGLIDGRIVQLTGIDIPGEKDGDNAVAAKRFVEDLFAKDRDIILHQTPDAAKGRTNRIDHQLAHVEQTTGRKWLQGALVSAGLARAWPTARNPELSDTLCKLEQTARDAKTGIWADGSPFAELDATKPDSIADGPVVVTGRVIRTAIVNNVVYLNFGDDWRKDFSVGIAPDIRRAFARANVDLLQLQGQTVRVRGWVRDYNGPFIDLETAEQLEFPGAEKPLPAPAGHFTVDPAPKTEPEAAEETQDDPQADQQNTEQGGDAAPVAGAIRQ